MQLHAHILQQLVDEAISGGKGQSKLVMVHHVRVQSGRTRGGGQQGRVGWGWGGGGRGGGYGRHFSVKKGIETAMDMNEKSLLLLLLRYTR
jgi:hypothetical protein